MRPLYRVRVSTTMVLVGVATLALAPAAGAAGPSPGTPKAVTFQGQGLRASWSAAAGTVTVDPGKRFTVRVRATTKEAPRAARVRITATRAAGDAGPRRVVRRTLRRGSFHLRAAKTPGTTYRVLIRIGSRSRTVRVTVAGPAATPVPTDQAAPVCDPNAGFLGTPTEAKIGIGTPYWISNDSGGALEHGAGVTWERQEGAGWVTAEMPGNIAVPAVLYRKDPGVSPEPRIAGVWLTLTPGIYRMALAVTCQSTGAQGVLYSAPIALTTLALPHPGVVTPPPPPPGGPQPPR